MQFTKTAVAAFIALVNLVAADSQEFGILSIHSASPVHYLTLHDKDGLFLTSGPDSLSASVTEAGKLKFSNGKFVVIGKDGKWSEGSESDASTGFAVASGELTYQGKQNFYAVPTSNNGNYQISGQNADGAIGVALSAWLTNGSRASDFAPSAQADAKSAVDATPSGAAPDATPAPAAGAAVSQINDGQVQANTKTTVAAVSQINDGQIQAATKTTVAAVSQIGDGQIQAATKTTVAAVSQIGDGQIQAATKTTVAAVSQINDGQIQAAKSTVAAVSQINDGQIQAAHSIQVQSENGVARLAMNGAGAIAAAVALLI